MFYKKSAKLAILALLLGSSFNVMSATTYRVKAGDSLSSIAKQFNVSTKDLMEMNNIRLENTINVGDVIIVNDSVAVRYAGKTTNYTIQAGDTVSSIVKKFDTTTAVLAELNPNLQAGFNQIYIGQKLVVPQVSTTNTNSNIIPAKANTPAAAETETTRQFTGKNFAYTVQRNDTFTGIANRFNVKAADLAKVNNVGATYKVKLGEVIYIPEIVDGLRNNSTNSNNSSSLSKEVGPAGKKSVSPNKTDTATTNTVKASNTSHKSLSPLQIDSFKYIVKSGDTLSGLAKKYNVTTSTLAELNDLNTNSKLKIDQKLLIPIVK